jgi:hypothetical protein
MPFDINTAKPFKTNFDISTAKPYKDMSTQLRDKTLPNYAQTEQKIAQRPDLLKETWNRIKNPQMEHRIKGFSSPLGTAKTALTGLGGLWQRGEAAIANPAMYYQGQFQNDLNDLRQHPTLKKAWNVAYGKPAKLQLQGLTGERKGEFGDVMRRSGAGNKYGINELLSSTAGLLASVGISNALMGGVVGKAEKGIKGNIAHGENYIDDTAKMGQTVSRKARNFISNIYDDLYKQADDIAVNPNEVDDVLLRMDFYDDAGGEAVNITNKVLKDIDNISGGRVNTIGKLKAVRDYLSSKVSRSAYKAGGTSGKGGAMSKDVRILNAKQLLGQIRNKSISAVDEGLSQMIQSVDDFASQNFYPTVQKMEGFFGKGKIPTSRNVGSAYAKGDIGFSSDRVAIKQAPEKFKKLGEIANVKEGALKLSRDAQLLLNRLNSLAKRRILKRVGGGAIGSGLAFEAIRRLRNSMGN